MTKLRAHYRYDDAAIAFQEKAASLGIELSDQEAACLVHSKCYADGSVKTDILDACDIVSKIDIQKLADLLFG